MTTATANQPDWLRQVPLETVGVLCATHMFGKNIESRHMLLAGKRFLHVEMENVVGYVLNPILPAFPKRTEVEPGTMAALALRNIRDVFNFIFHIQVEYFKVLNKLFPHRFRSARTGKEFNLNQFMAKGPTLLNSEKRYLILSTVDKAQPFDLDIDWGAPFDWTGETVRERFRKQLHDAQQAYRGTLRLGEWYTSRERNLILPIRTILDDLSSYFDHLGTAAYLMARNRNRGQDSTRRLIRWHLLETCGHLERFTLDMLRLNVFTIVKHDRDRLPETLLARVIRGRAEDESEASRDGYRIRHEIYSAMLDRLYRAIGYLSLE